MSPARAIAEALSRGGVTTQRAQALVIGEHHVSWCRYLKGHRSPKCSKVAEWMCAARSEGYELRVQWDADGAR